MWRLVARCSDAYAAGTGAAVQHRDARQQPDGADAPARSGGDDVRRSKDVSVTVVAVEADQASMSALLTDLTGQLREVRVAAPSEMGPAADGSDVVHAVGWEAGVAASRASLEVPLLVSPPALASGQGMPRDDDERSALRSADAVLVASSRHRDEVHQLGVPWYRLTTVPPCVDVASYARLGPAAPRTERLRIAAEPHPDDDVGSIFHALRLMDSPELVLFAPSESGTESLRDRATAEGLGDRTTVVAPSTDDERAWWLRSTDAVVAVPTGTTDAAFALQAMACGTAVVATPVDVLEDVVVHGVTGLHVPHGDGVSLARALRAVLADDFSIESFGMAGSDRAIHRFSTASVARDLASAYSRSALDPVEPDDDELDRASVSTTV
jgi:glycosyltransferase involved in cell wall biosynthesis